MGKALDLSEGVREALVLSDSGDGKVEERVQLLFCSVKAYTRHGGGRDRRYGVDHGQGHGRSWWCQGDVGGMARNVQNGRREI